MSKYLIYGSSFGHLNIVCLCIWCICVKKLFYLHVSKGKVLKYVGILVIPSPFEIVGSL